MPGTTFTSQSLILVQASLSFQSLTLVTLNVLVDLLKRLCLSHLTLPVLAMEDLLARDLVKSAPLKSLIHLR